MKVTLNATMHGLVASRGRQKVTCVPQQIIAGCGPLSTCVPIEELPLDDWRTPSHGDDGGWQPASEVILYPLRPARQDLTVRRVYIDLGANSYSSSIGSWFLKAYPDGEAYQVVAVEPERHYRRSYADHPEIELLHFAAFTRNGSVPWGDKGTGRAHMTRDGIPGDARPALDVSDFLKRRIKPADYVVMKVDIEGAEWDLIPHLLSTGAIHLVDELFVEIHTDINSCCYPPWDEGRHWADALRLMRHLRMNGVFAHMWG